jgi:hypothetical protein
LRSLKGKRPNHGSGTWITSFQAFLSKHNSIEIFHSFKSLLIATAKSPIIINTKDIDLIYIARCYT